MRRLLSLHTLDLSVSSETIDVAAVLDRRYVSNQLEGLARSSMHVEVEQAATPPSMPNGAVFAETTLCGARCYYADGRFFASTDSRDSVSVEYELAHDTLRATVTGAYRNDPYAIAVDLLRPLLQSFLLSVHGLKSLNGALVAREGRGIFLAGQGGAGKSTTAITLGLNGWDVLSDDGPLFAFAGGRACALSSLDFLHVTANTLAMFPQLAAYRVGGPDRRRKFAIDGRALTPGGSWRRPVAVADFIELRREAVPAPYLEPLDRAAILRRLIAEHMFVFRNPRIIGADRRLATMSEFILDLLSSLVAHARFHRLVYADDHLPLVGRMLETL